MSIQHSINNLEVGREVIPTDCYTAIIDNAVVCICHDPRPDQDKPWTLSIRVKDHAPYKEYDCVSIRQVLQRLGSLAHGIPEEAATRMTLQASHATSRYEER